VPELVRALTGKCGTVRGQIKAPVMEKCFRPMATGNRQQATGNYTHLSPNRVNYTNVYSLKKSKNNPSLSGIKPNMALYISMSLTYFRP
jgi:hypothetical protein